MCSPVVYAKLRQALLALQSELQADYVDLERSL